MVEWNSKGQPNFAGGGGGGGGGGNAIWGMEKMGGASSII